MTFDEALKKLNIEDYKSRIFNSNSRGELFHLQDYIVLAKCFEDRDTSGFRPWFVFYVEYAEKNWNRPESIFQHLNKIVEAAMDSIKVSKQP